MRDLTLYADVSFWNWNSTDFRFGTKLFVQEKNLQSELNPDLKINLTGKLIKNSFDIKSILKKLYVLGCRNLLVEGGNDLSKHIVKKRLFNEFYLYKCAKSLSKLVNHKEFSFLNELKKNYKNKLKINKKLGKDVITLYK